MDENYSPNNLDVSSNSTLKNKRFILLVCTFFILLVTMFYMAFFSAPGYFPVGMIYDLKSGQTLTTVASDFKNKRIIRSEFLFKALTYIFSKGSARVIEGDYALNNKQNVIGLAWRISHGTLKISPLKVVFTEGLNSFENAEILIKKMPSFNKTKFIDIVKKNSLEGYLFPDTYTFMPDVSELSIIKLMNDNYKIRIKTLENEIKSFGKPISDVIKMASILEGEARTLETRRIVAGILWKRLSMGMALQVDASFKYINGKDSKTLTAEDLKIDSPYNSYTRKGLPPTPISNPGLEAIEAAITPIKTPYLYFIMDDNGRTHYAETHGEHLANIEKYLK